VIGDQKIKSYRELLIWQKGIDLVTEVYKLTKKIPKIEKYALIDQMHRAVISVPSNIAEGQARQHPKEFRQFLYMALGSLAELDTQLIIAAKLGYIKDNDLNGLDIKDHRIKENDRRSFVQTNKLISDH
jgi:four helix bundle protein